MVAPVSESLRRDVRSIDLLEYVYGVGDRDRTVFSLVAASPEAVTVDEVAASLDCDRSTAYRSIRRLVEADLLVQTQIDDDGGYHYVYATPPAEEIADDMQRHLNDWYARVQGLVQSFEESCGGTSSA